jgi:hypothetical protein
VRKPYQVVESVRSGEFVKTFKCFHCGNPATKAAYFREDGVVLVERYCDRCSEPANFERLQEWYDTIQG